ncbi:MAG: CDP-glucose 4,6-dehydratase [Hyphomicrobium sp. 32-62-53]|nr:MAG: CDP-glucose 4,6-dehydratase [Hyphomicrobium sp. 12-62-95]OYX98676.1 MAG: CDP-glucose 4,6-dehydratase [Hyphomicrobium sp. 32-62-53]
MKLDTPPVNADFWRARHVLLTGHTGFKGTWATHWLSILGADVTGLALAPDTVPSMFELTGARDCIAHHVCDIRDGSAVAAVVGKADPELVLHMAAQPLVRRSVREPVDTFATNVMGTVNLLEALRSAQRLKAVLVVTTDKVYENSESGLAFCEEDALGGHDPYAASKAACEIAVSSFARTYFAEKGIPVATARGGNVIGGGDFSEDRLVPDIWRAMQKGEALRVRYPRATRPWQHVLDCLAGYLTYLAALAEGRTTERALNFGPEPGSPMMVAEIVASMQQALGTRTAYVLDEGPKPREMLALTLNSERARNSLNWSDRLPGEAALQATAGWYKALADGEDMRRFTLYQIDAFMTARAGQLAHAER